MVTLGPLLAPALCPDVPSRFCSSQVGRGARTLGLTSPLPLPPGARSRLPSGGQSRQGVVLAGRGAQASWWEGSPGAAGSNNRPSAGRVFQAVSTTATDVVPGNHPEVRSLRHGRRHGARTQRDAAALNFTERREVTNSKYAAEPGTLNRHSGCGRGPQCLGVRQESHIRWALAWTQERGAVTLPVCGHHPEPSTEGSHDGVSKTGPGCGGEGLTDVACVPEAEDRKTVSSGKGWKRSELPAGLTCTQRVGPLEHTGACGTGTTRCL